MKKGNCVFLITNEHIIDCSRAYTITEVCDGSTDIVGYAKPLYRENGKEVIELRKGEFVLCFPSLEDQYKWLSAFDEWFTSSPSKFRGAQEAFIAGVQYGHNQSRPAISVHYNDILRKRNDAAPDILK